MRDPRKQTDASAGVEYSMVAEGSRSKVVPIHPGWPPAELPSHEHGLRQVGEPLPISRDWGYES